MLIYNTASYTVILQGGLRIHHLFTNMPQDLQTCLFPEVHTCLVETRTTLHRRVSILVPHQPPKFIGNGYKNVTVKINLLKTHVGYVRYTSAGQHLRLASNFGCRTQISTI